MSASRLSLERSKSQQWAALDDRRNQNLRVVIQSKQLAAANATIIKLQHQKKITYVGIRMVIYERLDYKSKGDVPTPNKYIDGSTRQ